MTITEAFHRLSQLNDKIRVSIFFHGDLTQEWTVRLEWRNGTTINPNVGIDVTHRNKDFETALNSAWKELDGICNHYLKP